MTLIRCPECGRHAMADAVECPTCGAALPDDDRLYESFVGRRWASHYRDRLTRFHREDGGRVSWNWAAFLVPGWFLYRKLYDYWIGFVLLFMVCGAIEGAAGAIELTGVAVAAAFSAFLGVPILQGLFGDYLLFRRARKVIAHLRSRTADPEALHAAVARRGGTTLIPPLLVVVPIAVIWLGIVAWVSLPQFASTRELAFQFVMESDLRDLVNLQKTFLTEHGRYAASTEELAAVFAPTPNVSLTITPTADGWMATATHDLTAIRCQVYVGKRPDDLVGSFVTEPDVPACDHIREGTSETPGPED